MLSQPTLTPEFNTIVFFFSRLIVSTLNPALLHKSTGPINSRSSVSLQAITAILIMLTSLLLL